MKRYHFSPLLLSILIFLCISCQPKKAEETTPTEAQEVVAAPPAYPPLGNAAITTLFGEADHVDIIFYNLPISVNQNDPASVKNTVMYITPASPQITAQCKPLGRLSWMKEGAILREADIYVGTGCDYLMFIENNQPVAANAMAPEGVQFFNNIISQVQKMKQ